MLPNQPTGARPSTHAKNDLGEESRLDEAMERADQLLVTSLKKDERLRGRRRVLLIALGVVIAGGLVMSLILCLVFLNSGTDAQKPSAPLQGPAAQTGQEPRHSQAAQTKTVAFNNADDAGRLSAEGWSLWQKQDVNAAAAKFEQAVKLDPKNVGAWNGLGWASFSASNFEAANKAFHKAIALEQKHPAALNGLGQVALSQRKYAEAEKYLLQAAPQASAAWYGLTKVYLLTGKYEKAAKWAEKIIQSGEADPDVQRLLAAAKKRDLPADLRKMIEPDPHGTSVARAWQLMNQGRSDDAKALFKEVLLKDPRYAAALNGMGWCLLNAGNLDEAKTYFQKTLAVEPLAGGSLNGLARVYSAQGETEQAIKIWQKMVDKIPGPHAGTAGLADAYFEKKEYKKAVPLLEQLAKANPNDEEVKHKLELARTGEAK
jgi:tetratricopeptide (TPR) repeat protein